MGKSKATKPTRDQKAVIMAAGLIWQNWLVLSESDEELHIVSRGAGVSRTNKLIICSIPQFEGKCKPLERSDDMSYYRTCQYCGANLDPGETCDCQIEKKEQETV